MRTSGWDGNNWVDGGTGNVGKGADSGTGNSRDGNKTPYDGMADGVPTFAARILEILQ